MPTPSYDVLRQQRDQAIRAFNDLSEDPDFGVTTYRALLYALMHMGENPGEFVVLISFDQEISYRLRSTVKRLLHLRDASVTLRGCGENPGEFVFLTAIEPSEFVKNFQASANKAGFQFTAAWCAFTGDLYADMRTCQALIQAHREGYPV